MEQIAATAEVARARCTTFPVKEAVLAHWLHLERATNLAMLHDQLKTRPGFADGAVHVLNRSAEWCERPIGTEPSPSRGSEQLSDIAEPFNWLNPARASVGGDSGRLDSARLTIAIPASLPRRHVRRLADLRLKLRKEFDAAVPNTASKASPKPRKRRS